MLDFDTYITRYGEFCMQDLIERIERQEGIKPNLVLPLEERWNSLMNDATEQRLAA